VTPAFFIFFLFVLNEGVENSTKDYDFTESVSHQNEEDIPSIPLCVLGPNTDQCWTFLYTPKDNSEVNEIIQLVSYFDYSFWY
jgi:hypothetical protein